MFIGVCTREGCLKCQRVMVSAWDKVICRNSGFTFQTFIKQNEPSSFLEGLPFQFCKKASHATFFNGIFTTYTPSCTFLHIF